MMKTQFREFPVPVGSGTLPCLLAEPETPAEHPALLLNFAMDRHTTMRESPYDIPVQAFLAAGHRAASFDLPCHGDRASTGGPREIAGFSAELVAGKPVFDSFVEEGHAVLDALINSGFADPDRIVVSGTSRGGYCALRLMAAESRIKAAAAFTPVTDWRVLREFSGATDHPAVAAASLANYAPSLAGRYVWITIGNKDERVGTTDCLRFAEDVIAAGRTKGLPSPGMVLHVVPATGHSVPEAWRAAGASFLLDRVAGSKGPDSPL